MHFVVRGGGDKGTNVQVWRLETKQGAQDGPGERVEKLMGGVGKGRWKGNKGGKKERGEGEEGGSVGS